MADVDLSTEGGAPKQVVAAAGSSEEMYEVASLIRAYEIVKGISGGNEVNETDVKFYASDGWSELSKIWKDATVRPMAENYSSVTGCFYKAYLGEVDLDEPLKQILSDNGFHICEDEEGAINICSSQEFARDVLKIQIEPELL